MSANLETEAQFFRLFVQKHKVDRFIDRINNPKKRHLIWNDLRDIRYFDSRFVSEVTGVEKNAEDIASRLTSLGLSKNVYLLSPDEDIDGTEVNLHQVLRVLWDREEMLGYCAKSKIGFFKTHEDWFYILRKQ